MTEFSIVTLVKERRKQLANLLDSISRSTVLPYDIQVVCMDNADDIAIPAGLNVNVVRIEGTHQLPLAASRNMGISSAHTDKVIFVDVDCIVSPTLFENMLMALERDNVIAAYPLYLPVLPETGDYEQLKLQGVAHPSRDCIQVGQPIEHLQFWSLIFAIEKQTFEKIGGFDESFTGYGAEDTDFAMMFNRRGIKQYFVQDFILHQYHAKYDPPLNYFDSIIQNARRYQQKWDILPMRRWLSAFEDLGLIAIDEGDQITVLKEPDEAQISESRSVNPY